MRWLLPVVWLGCGTHSAAPVAHPPSVINGTTPAPAPTRAAPTALASPPTPSEPSAKPAQAPPLARFGRAHDIYMIVTEHGETACRRWKVTPGDLPGVGHLVAGGDSIRFETHGAALALTDRHLATSHNRTQAAQCSATFAIREVEGGLDVDGGRWFEREADCARAIATRQRVAIDLSSCDLAAEANLQEQAASQRAFEAMLRDGGAAYAIVEDDCVAVRATPRVKGQRDYFEGEISSAVRDGARRGKSGFTYQMARHALEITLLGPFTEWSDGSATAMGCGDVQSLSYGRDSVELGQTHYLSRASCRAALKAERERLSWLPAPAPEPGDEPGEELAGMAVPSIGGC